MFSPPERSRGIGVRVQRFEGGVLFRVDPGTLLGWHVYFFGSYEPEIRKVIKCVLHPGSVAIDVGANVGWHTLLMAARVREEGRVLAFEPNPTVRQRLCEAIELNRLAQVSVHDCALSDTSGRVRFNAPMASDPRAGTGCIAGRPGSSETDCMVEVRCETLDNVLQSTELARVDFIKIDVEGWEWNVLRGASATLQRYRPHIVFEYDANYVERGGGSMDGLAEFFASRGYSLFQISRRGPKPVTTPWPGCINILAVPGTP